MGNLYTLEISFKLSYGCIFWTNKTRTVSVKKCESSLSPVPNLAVFVFPKSVTLTCTGTGFPVPEIQFYKDNKPLGNWGESQHSNKTLSNQSEMYLIIFYYSTKTVK